MPTSTPQIAAASSYDAPLAPTKIKTSRGSGKLGQRCTQIREREVALLISGNRDRSGEFAVSVLDLAEVLAMVRIENVAKDGEETCAKI